ncbi:MAG: hypothetical protein K9M10_03330 [Candidatus Pacebacteria bacterium]|nr:hypothetical protein [Candidatus Paceibacterota bacterium]MCF7857486.1 hypothetical protein [Candidatus Paceibacterota bacterium]
MSRTLTPFLSIIIAILLFLFFTQPNYEEVKNLQKETEEYVSATEKYNNFNTRIEELLTRKDSIKESQKKMLDLLVPKSIDDTRTLVDLKVLAEKNGLLFGNVSIEGGDIQLQAKSTSGNKAKVSTTGSKELVTSDISFEVIGFYPQFKDFLRDIESSLTIMEVVDITFTSNESRFQQFSVKIRTYALPQGK